MSEQQILKKNAPARSKIYVRATSLEKKRSCEEQSLCPSDKSSKKTPLRGAKLMSEQQIWKKKRPCEEQKLWPGNKVGKKRLCAE